MVEVSCVLGSCAPARLKTVVAVSLAVGAQVVYKLPHGGSAEDLAALLDIRLGFWLAGGARRVVIETPELTRPAELLAAFERLRADHPGQLRLRGLITAVDATQLAAELEDESYVVVDAPESLGAEPVEGRAQIVVDQIEFADVLVVSEAVVSEAQAPGAPAVEPLLRALAPRAQLVPLRRGPSFELPRDRGVEHDSSGWMRLLTQPPRRAEEPLPEDAIVSFVYSHVRPFHPGRLMTLLNGSVDRGVFGTVVRSAGFCRFSTRPERPAHWSQVGHIISFDPLPTDLEAGADGELLAVGQEIAFIGDRLNSRSLTNALDSCTLSDEEFAAGPEAWRRYDDPVPRWAFEDDQSER